MRSKLTSAHERNSCFRFLACALLAVTEVGTSECTPEKPARVCPENYVSTTNPVFCLRRSRFRLPWMEARESCQLDGGDLIIGHGNKVMRNVFVFYNQDYLDFQSTGFWLGLTKNRARKWVWLGEKSEISFRRFLGFTRDRFSCAKAIFTATDRLIWEELSCSTTSLVFCQRPIPEKNPTNSNLTAFRCGRDWREITEMKICVRDFYEFGAKSFQEAKEICQKYSSNLFKIRNYSEHLLLTAYARDTRSFWVGIRDVDGERNFQWIDGYDVKLDHVFWEQKHDIERPGSCILLSNAGLSTAECLSRNYFICMRESPAGPTLPKMELSFDATEGVLFRDRIKTVTCTSRRVPGGEFTWTVVKNGSEHAHFNVRPEQVENQVASVMRDGECVREVVSTFTFNATSYFEDAYIGCYAFSYHALPWCLNSENPLTFCASSPKLKLINAGKENHTIVRPSEAAVWPKSFTMTILVLFLTSAVVVYLSISYMGGDQGEDGSESSSESRQSSDVTVSTQ